MPTDRPILRLPDPREVPRKKGKERSFPQPSGPGRGRQGERLGPRFVELSEALQRPVELANNPAGIAPERALVFETAGSIQGFARAARAVGLELIAEMDLEETEDFPEGFEPPTGSTRISQTLYTTMPTLRSAQQLLTLWNAHQAGEAAPQGAAPWWKLFDRLLKLRVWGPEDRFPSGARKTIEERLQGRGVDEAIKIEFEIWPSANRNQRDAWREETEAKIVELGGTVAARSSISGRGFVYEAVLGRLPVRAIRGLLADPNNPGGLGWVRGVQFILPQTIAQALPDETEDSNTDLPERQPFSATAPILCALFDGTPVAAHPALDGGVLIEDVHNLVPRSQVRQRTHATSMASLILRGDLESDGTPLSNTRLMCVPIVVDTDEGGRSPDDKLFVDVLHVALTRLFVGEDALAASVFIVNLSIGITEMRFGGRISALARLVDWWSHEHGVLFVVSAGNVFDLLALNGMTPPQFLGSSSDDQRKAVREALKESGYARCLMSPAEALNALTVGAISEDLAAEGEIPVANDIVRLNIGGRRLPAATSALGLGPFRSIKPDFLETGGLHELRAIANEASTNLRLVGRENGLVVASPRHDARKGMRRARGTSCAAALTSRAILRSAAALVEEGGPYLGQELPRMDLALLTRALCVNAADWSDDALAHYTLVHQELGPNKHVRAKEDVCRNFGYGHLSVLRMVESPGTGVTLVAVNTLRKDQSKIFDLPLPQSLSGQRVGRSMRVTLAWFSPVDSARARYRLASLQAIASNYVDGEDEDKDAGWGLLMQASGPDERTIAKGTVWSKRLVNKRLASPAYEDEETVPIRVQCLDASGAGALSKDVDIRFALAVTLEVEAGVELDIYQEIRARVQPRLRAGP
jgi:Subtilase family